MHNGRIQLDDTIFIGKSTQSNAVVVWVILDDIDTRDDRVKCVCTLQDEFHCLSCCLKAIRTRDDHWTNG